MGLMIYDWNEGTKIFGHNGLTHGYETCYAFDDARKNAVIILVNYDTKSNLWKQAINILQMIKFNN